MKNLITIVLLSLLAVACGSGGGGSSSSPTPGNGGSNPVADYDAFLAKTVYTFHLVVESCNGGAFTVVAFTDKTWPEENRTDWNGNIDNSGTTNITVTGRELEWNLDKISGGCPNMTMKLYRQFGAGVPALIDTKVIVNDGESQTITF